MRIFINGKEQKLWYICKYIGFNEPCKRKNDKQCPKLSYPEDYNMIVEKYKDSSTIKSVMKNKNGHTHAVYLKDGLKISFDERSKSLIIEPTPKIVLDEFS